MTKKETKSEKTNKSGAELSEDETATDQDALAESALTEPAVAAPDPAGQDPATKADSAQDSDHKEASGGEAAQADTDAVVDEEVEEAEKKPLGPGAQLAAIREAAGIEHEQVAASLKMTLRQIRALESDNYDALHGIAISRGFVRAYAKFLQVDPEPLVAMFSAADPIARPIERPPQRSKPERVVQHSDRRFGSSRRSSRRGIIIALAILIALTYVVYAMKWLPAKWIPFLKDREAVSQSRPGEVKPVPVEVEMDKKVPEESGEDPEADQATEEEGEVPGEQGQQTPQEQAPAEPARSGEEQNQQAETVKVSQVQPEPEPPVPAPDLLLMRFKGPSNVRLLKADASVMNEFDGKTGDVQIVDITEPSTLVVEKSDNVDVEFRSAAIFLRSARRSTEARVELK